jgi:hypothetical protein
LNYFKSEKSAAEQEETAKRSNSPFCES